MTSEPNKQRTFLSPTLMAWMLTLVLVLSFSVIMLIRPEFFVTEINIKKPTEEEIQKRKIVRIEKREPTPRQVREITRNEERKKREKLKERVRDLVEIERELAEEEAERLEEIQDNYPELLGEEPELASPDEDADMFADDEFEVQEEEDYGEFVSELLEDPLAPLDELYETAQNLEESISEHFAEARAAELALVQQKPLDEAREAVYVPETNSPDLAESLSEQSPTTQQEFQEYNKTMEQAATAMQSMVLSAQAQLEQVTGGQNSQKQGVEGANVPYQPGQNITAQVSAMKQMSSMNQGRGKNQITDLSSVMMQAYGMESFGGQGGDDYDSGLILDGSYSTDLGKIHTRNGKQTLRLNTARVTKQALPGRKLTDSSERSGWLFLDTWYIIGPWNRPKNNSFKTTFPPETIIDLDAEYKGKVVRGNTEPIDLKWRFIQSNSIRIRPPDEINDSVYYAYTDLYSDRARQVLVAVASDDLAKLWVNDLPVWEDSGLSSWKLDEGFSRIVLKEGYNKVLVRIESGPGLCEFSVLLCPIAEIAGG